MADELYTVGIQVDADPSDVEKLNQSLRALQATITQTNNIVGNLQSGFDDNATVVQRSASAFAGFGATALSVSGQIKQLATYLLGMISVVVAVRKSWQEFTSAIQITGQLQDLGDTFLSLAGNTQAAQKQLSGIMNFWRSTKIFDQSDLINAATNMKLFGIATENILPYLQRLAVGAAAVNSTVTQMEMAMEQLIRGRIMVRTREMQIIIQQIGKNIGSQAEAIQRLSPAVSTAEERMQLVLQAWADLGREGSAAFGAIESKQATYMGKLAALHNQWVQLKQVFAMPIVTALGPVMDELIGGMEDGTSKADRWGKAMANAISGADRYFKGADWNAKLTSWSESLDTFTKGWNALHTAIQKLDEFSNKVDDTGAKMHDNFGTEGLLSWLDEFGAKAESNLTNFGDWVDDAGDKIEKSIVAGVQHALDKLAELSNLPPIKLAFQGAAQYGSEFPTGAELSDMGGQRFGGGGQRPTSYWWTGGPSGANRPPSSLNLYGEAIPTIGSNNQLSMYGLPQYAGLGGGNWVSPKAGEAGWMEDIDTSKINEIAEGNERLASSMQQLGADAQVLTDYWKDYNDAMAYSNDATSREWHQLQALEKAIKGLGNPMAEIEKLIVGLSPDRQAEARWAAWNETVERALKTTEIRMKAGIATMGESMRAGLAVMSREWGTWQEQSAKAIKAIGDALASDIAGGLTDILTGAKSAKEGFRDMAQAIIKDIEQIILKMLVQMAIQRLVGMIPGMAGLGATPVYMVAAPKQTGGRIGTGYGGGDRIPHMLEEGEFVWNKKAAAAIGYDKLEAINNAYYTGGVSGMKDGVMHAQQGVRVRAMTVGRWHGEKWHSANWHGDYQLGQWDVHSSVFPLGTQFEYRGHTYTVRGPSDRHGRAAHAVEFMDPQADAWDMNLINVHVLRRGWGGQSYGAGPAPSRWQGRRGGMRAMSNMSGVRPSYGGRAFTPAERMAWGFVEHGFDVPRASYRLGQQIPVTFNEPEPQFMGFPVTEGQPLGYSDYFGNYTYSPSGGGLPPMTAGARPELPASVADMMAFQSRSNIVQFNYPEGSQIGQPWANPPTYEVMYPSNITETYNPAPSETGGFPDYVIAPDWMNAPPSETGGFPDYVTVPDWMNAPTFEAGPSAFDQYGEPSSNYQLGSPTLATDESWQPSGGRIRRSTSRTLSYSDRMSVRFGGGGRGWGVTRGGGGYYYTGTGAPTSYPAQWISPTGNFQVGAYGVSGGGSSYFGASGPGFMTFGSNYNAAGPILSVDPIETIGRAYQKYGGGPGWFMSQLNTRRGPSAQGQQTIMNWMSRIGIQVWNPTGGKYGAGAFVRVPGTEAFDVHSFTQQHPTWMTPSFIHGTGHGTGAGYYRPYGIAPDVWGSPQWGTARPPVTYWKGNEEVKFGDPLWYELRRGADFEDLGVTIKHGAGYDEWLRINNVTGNAWNPNLPGGGLWRHPIGSTAPSFPTVGSGRAMGRNYDTGGIADWPLMLQTGGRVKAGEAIIPPDVLSKMAPAVGQVNNVSISILNQGGKITSDVRTSGDGGLTAEDAKHISRLVVQVCRATIAGERRAGGQLYSPRA